MWSLYHISYMCFIHSWINKLLSEENKVPEHCLKLESWQGPPHINKVQQYENVLFFNWVYSVMETKRVCLGSLFSAFQKIFLFYLQCPPQNYVVHL